MSDKPIWDVSRSGDEIIIKISIADAVKAVEQNPDQDLRVVDVEAMGNHFVKALTEDFDDQGRPIIGGVLDDIAYAAFAEGEEFIVDPTDEDE